MPELYKIYVMFLGTLVIYGLFENQRLARSNIVYWICATPLVLYTCLRPVDISRDDIGYQGILAKIDEEQNRDFAWYALVKLFNWVSGGYRSVLFLTGLFLLLKLWMLSCLKNNKILVLFMYSTIYWQLHDITQLRLSIGMACVFAILVFYERAFAIKRYVLIGAASLFHIQLAILFFSEAFCWFRFFSGWKRALVLLLATYSIVQLNLEPDTTAALHVFFDKVDSVIGRLLVSYSALEENHKEYGGIKYPIIMLIGYLIWVGALYFDQKNNARFASDYIANSVSFSMILVMIVSGLNDVMVRFFELYIAFFIVYAGKYAGRNASLLLMGLGFLYFLKFNFFWALLAW